MPSSPEVRLAPSPPGFAHALERALEHFDPGLRVVARDLLGLSSRIDLIARDAHGQAVLVLVEHEAQGSDLLVRGLAQCAWLAPRIRDWLQLAPDLGLRPEIRPRGLLVASEFSLEMRSACASLPSGMLTLLRSRCLSVDERPRVVLESLGEGPDFARAAHPMARVLEPAPGAELPPFRSGLHDEDLHAGLAGASPPGAPASEQAPPGRSDSPRDALK